MTRIGVWLDNPAHRLYLYRIAVAVLALLSFYGIITDEAIAVWCGVIGALTNVLAMQNVSTIPPEK